MHLPKSKHPAHQDLHQGKGIHLGQLQPGHLLKKLSEAVGINPYYLSHLFRKEMGISFLEYLTSVRMSIAKNLLKQTTMTMMEICLEVGYQDPSHFAKIFKKKEGIHPTEYRNRTLDSRV